MRVRSARLDELELDLVEPFETSFGVERRRRLLLLSIQGESGETGVAECVAARDPLYSSESVATARWMMGEYLLPDLLEHETPDPGAFLERVRQLKGHPMAKACVEMALWDLWARERRVSLSKALGGRRRRIEVGVSVGIQPTVDLLVRRVGRYLEEGYLRIKLKVRPGWDEVPVGAVRREYPDLRIWVDANQAYPPAAAPAILRWARRAGVEQVEQPFAERELEAHARLNRSHQFRVCLDESIVDRPSLEEAIRRKALSSLNVKPGRVGGLASSRGLEQVAAEAMIPAWVGGMLETGIGRAHAVSLATLPNFVLPADLSASRRYYRSEIITAPFELGPGSTLAVPAGAGIGVELDERALARARRRSRVYRTRSA
jgi:o-succinylbenzoate synthase